MGEAETVRLKFTSKTLYDLIRESTGLLLFPKKTSTQINQEIFNVLYAGYLRAKFERIGKDTNIDEKLATAEKIFVLYVEKHLGIEGLKDYCDATDVIRYLPTGNVALSPTHSEQLCKNKKKTRLTSLVFSKTQNTIPLVQEINGIFSHDTFDGSVDRLMFADSLHRVVYDIPSQDRFLALKDAHGREVEYKEKRVLSNLDRIVGSISKFVPDITNPGIVTSPFQYFDGQAEDLDAKLKGPNPVVKDTTKIYAQDTSDWFLKNSQKSYPARLIMLKVVKELMYARKLSSSDAQPSGEKGRYTRQECYLVFEINETGVLNFVLTYKDICELKTFIGEGTTNAVINAKLGRTNYRQMETYLHAEVTTTYKSSFINGLDMAITSRRFSGKHDANPVEEYSLELIGGNGVKYRLGEVLLNPDGPYKMEMDDYTGKYLPSELLIRGLTLLNKSNGKLNKGNGKH